MVLREHKVDAEAAPPIGDDALPPIVVTNTPAGDLESVSLSYHEYTGLSLDQARQWVGHGVIHEDDLPSALALWEQARIDGSPISNEVRLRRHDGVYRWHTVQALPVKDAAGNLLRWVSVSVDTHDRRALIDALRASEERNRSLVEALPALIVTTTAAGEIEEISKSYEDYTGLTVEEARDWQAHSVIHPDDMEQSMTLWGEALATGAPMQNEMRLRRHDGVYRWYLVQARPIRDAGAAIARWVTVNIDIEDRKRAEMYEHYLAETTARLVSPIESTEMLAEIARLAVPGLADVCAIGLFDGTDQTARIETAGPDESERPDVARIHLRRWRAAPGSDATVGDTIAAALPVFVPDFDADWIDACAPDDEQRAAALAVNGRSLVCVPLLTRGETTGMATFATTRSRRRYTERDLAVLRQVAGRLSIAIENVRLFTELRQTADELRHANAAKDEFLSLVSHELRTPITVILGNARVLAKRGAEIDEADRTAALNDVAAEADRLNRIIENLLVLARLEREAGDVGQVDVDETVARILDAHRKQYARRDIRVTIAETAPLVAVGSEFCVEQVLRNLLSNAEKYSPPLTPLDVQVSAHPQEIAVAVSDRGTGIPKGELERVFEPFYRSAASTNVSGVGIGLTVCKRLIESQGGRIWAEAREGGGTTMCFTLPLGPAPADA